MAEAKPGLEWREHSASFSNAWVCGAELSAWTNGRWFVECHGRQVSAGTAVTLLAAQVAAEAAALAWLSEGIAAFGGRVLTAEQAALALESLRYCIQYRLETMREQSMRTLARELEGGDHG